MTDSPRAWAHRVKRTRPSRRVLVVVAAVVAAGVGAGAALALASSGGSKRVASPPVRPTSTTSGDTPASTAPARSWVAVENAKPGTSDWTVQHPSKAGEIEGYLSTVSAQAGQTLQLYVTTNAPSFTATAYRLGWYGGKLARKVWSSASVPGSVQAPATRDPATNMVETAWKPSLPVAIGTDWPPGDYLFKLVSSTGWDSYVPLTVRDDSSHAPVMIVNAVTTWQAYNLWGDYDLYAGPKGAAQRAKVVSFDRPYRLGDGSGDFLGNEEKLVKLVEKDGLDVSYTTDVDLGERPATLTQHRVLVSLGHDEYWSTAMRNNVTAARDHGVNLAFLGANAVFRHIRLEPSALGPDRHEVNYRVAADDPMLATNPAEVTVSWRDPPVSKPENALLGEMYECNPVDADLVVTNPGAWVFAGTGLTAGQHLAHLVGSEYDHWSAADGGPPVEVMADSPVVCHGRRSTADLTYTVAASGAGVIDTGTNQWVPRILDDPAIGATVATITETILREASQGPLGSVHPLRPSASPAPAGPKPPTGE